MTFNNAVSIISKVPGIVLEFAVRVIMGEVLVSAHLILFEISNGGEQVPKVSADMPA